MGLKSIIESFFLIEFKSLYPKSLKELNSIIESFFLIESKSL